MSAIPKFVAAKAALSEALAVVLRNLDHMSLEDVTKIAQDRSLEADAYELRVRAEHRLGQLMDKLGIEEEKKGRC
jgi:hypothetical protein